MKRLLLAGAILFLVASVAFTPALTQEAKQTEQAKETKSTTKRSASSHVRIDPKDGRPLSPKSAASRMALCRTDCSPQKYDQATNIGIHGIYRRFNDYDPQLRSAQGQKSYAECVKKCSDPLPAVYVQRALFAAGLKSWFGMTKEDCLNCHAKGY